MRIFDEVVESAVERRREAKPKRRATSCLFVALGKPLPKTAESCAAAPRQFGGATAKMVANPYSTFHKPDFCKISMPT